jgi:putative ABC transport system substrate-binding protein
MRRITRGEFITLLGGAAAWPLTARAQQPTKVARIGYVRQTGPDSLFDAFRDGMRAAGYVEGQNLVIEQRYAAGAYERLSSIATELVRANVEVIVVDGTAAAKACKDATTTIPVVFALAVDPVSDGLVASFARPGGNLTGLTLATGYELQGKRLELLKDIVTSLSRVAVLGNPTNPTYGPYLQDTERAATALGLEVRAFGVRGPDDLPGAFAAMAEWRAGGMVTFADAMLFTQRNGRVGSQDQAANRTSLGRKRGCRRACVLRSQPARPVPPSGHLCGQDLERRKAGRPSCRTADQVRSSHQS